MRLIDADKLKIRETWALVENVSDTKNAQSYDMGIVPKGISFAPLSCVLKKDIDDAPTIDAIVHTIEVSPQYNIEGFKKFAESKIDMQDLYLPTHFFDLLDEYFGKEE